MRTTILKNYTASVIAIILLTVLSGCVGKNSFEDAVDPVTGNEKKYSEWADNGGLNKLNDFYGVKISKLHVTWGEDQVTRLSMWASLQHSPKDVRKAMQKICGGDDKDWKISDDFGFRIGEYDGPRGHCTYLGGEWGTGSPPGRDNWALTYRRKEYPTQIRKNFVASCTKTSQGQTKACECVLAKFESYLPYEAFLLLEDRFKEGTVPPSTVSDMNRFRRECGFTN